ncbi:hypothetical protein NIES4075_57150 [Tolypothrix sp. NIES-4075]|nr:hypothetical protein NIES4075_57150 [Tolypothrix sp. NIES-4075]
MKTDKKNPGDKFIFQDFKKLKVSFLTNLRNHESINYTITKASITQL